MLKQLKEPFLHKKEIILIKQQGPGQKNKIKAKDWKGTLKRVWKYLATHKLPLILVLALVVISSFLGLMGPYLIGMGIDTYIVERDNSGLLTLIGILLIIYSVHSISLWLQNVGMINIAQKTVYTMRVELFQQLHKLPIAFFDKRQHGELMSRVTNDIENISSTLNSSVIQVFSSALTLIGIVSVMLYLSPLLTVITMTIIPLMVFGMKWITKRTGPLFKEQQKHLGDMNGFIEETISGQRIVKTFSQEERVVAQFQERNKRLKEASFWAQTISGFIPKLMNVLNNLSFTIIAGIGGIFAINGYITIGMIVIFAEYARQFTRPLNDLANQFNTILSAIAGAERVFEVLDEEDEANDERNAAAVRTIRGDVVFQRVSFSYNKESNTVKEISLRVQPGETVALVGATGAGKTTIINLLSRFYEPDSGTIFIDGKDIREIKRESLREKLGFVLQDAFLFEGSIKENIRYGKLDATDEEIVDAAKDANAHSFIMKLPEQYDTILSQDGTGISQGQRQLLTIARVILSNPSMLILDEATSNIDTITEIKIQEALNRLMANKTCFVIAHRLNTIERADQILVLEDGRIIESGNHHSLLKNNGFYAKLVQSQFMEEKV